MRKDAGEAQSSDSGVEWRSLRRATAPTIAVTPSASAISSPTDWSLACIAFTQVRTAPERTSRNGQLPPSGTKTPRRGLIELRTLCCKPLLEVELLMACRISQKSLDSRRREPIITSSPAGRLTQRLECHPHTVEVAGSNPAPPIRLMTRACARPASLRGS